MCFLGNADHSMPFSHNLWGVWFVNFLLAGPPQTITRCSRMFRRFRPNEDGMLQPILG